MEKARAKKALPAEDVCNSRGFNGEKLPHGWSVPYIVYNGKRKYFEVQCMYCGKEIEHTDKIKSSMFNLTK